MIWAVFQNCSVVYSLQASVLIRNALLWRHEPFNCSVICSWFFCTMLLTMSLALCICSLPLFKIGWKWFSTTHGGHFKKFSDMLTTVTLVKNLWTIYVIMYQSNRSFNIPRPLGIPRAFDDFSCPGRREFDHRRLPGGGALITSHRGWGIWSLASISCYESRWFPRELLVSW